MEDVSIREKSYCGHTKYLHANISLSEQWKTANWCGCFFAIQILKCHLSSWWVSGLTLLMASFILKLNFHFLESPLAIYTQLLKKCFPPLFSSYSKWTCKVRTSLFQRRPDKSKTGVPAGAGTWWAWCSAFTTSPGLYNLAFNTDTAVCTHALVISRDIQCQVRQINSTYNVTTFLLLDTKEKLTQVSIVYQQEQSV